MDLGYLGPVALGDTLPIGIVCRNGSLVPTAPDSAPSFTIYPPDSNTSVASGNLSASDTDSKTGFRTGEQDATEGNGFDYGLYRGVIEYAISATAYKSTFTFSVV